jgi:thiol-disulfide isomerase/thioredoxin
MLSPAAAWRGLRRRYWTSLAFDALIIIAVFWAIHAWNTRNLPGPGEVPLLEASVLGIDGPPQSLPSGGPGVVYFFAPWCFYCKHSIDHIDDLVENGEVAWARAVALDYADLEEVRGFVDEVGLAQSVLLGSAATAGDWSIRAFPTYFVIGADGGIASRSVGYATKLGMKTRAILAR